MDGIKDCNVAPEWRNIHSFDFIHVNYSIKYNDYSFDLGNEKNIIFVIYNYLLWLYA